MNDVFSPISALSHQFGPALTWYRANSETQLVSNREELGAPVVARWLAKMSNLMGTDLADLFGGEGAARCLAVDMPGTWQEVMWVCAARLMGWQVILGADEASACDVFVTNSPTPALDAHLADGCDVLLHNTQPLALAWNQELPAGTMDALEALMSQPDALIVNLAPSATAPASTPAREEGQAPRALLTYPSNTLHEELLTLWARGSGAIVTPSALSASELDRIAEVEKITKR